MLDEFISYLKEQLGQPYLWGGQHTKLTPDNYVAVINKKEDGRGGYAGGPTYAEAVISFCKKKFDKGATELFAYDCSGIGCWFLFNLHHLYKSDVNANTMMTRCTLKDELPKRGWWVFKLSGTKASHVGYMISDTTLIEAKGRKYGVVETTFKKSDWDRWGIPAVFEKEILEPEPEPEPEPDPKPEPSKRIVVVVGKSVRVHKKPTKLSKTLWFAHSAAYYKAQGSNRPNDLYYLLDIADNGWYHVSTIATEHDRTGYITNKEKYTKLVIVKE